MAQQDLYLLLIHQIGQTGGLQLGIPVISLSSAWQHQALMKRRYQVEQQQLAEMRSRSVLQRLRAVFVAD
jgi:hypothetical protein